MTIYGNITEEVLNVELGECFENGAYYLRTELDKLDEEIVHAEWKLDKTDLIFPKLESFRAWTDTNVIQIVQSGFGDQIVVVIPRNPPNN